MRCSFRPGRAGLVFLTIASLSAAACSAEAAARPRRAPARPVVAVAPPVDPYASDRALIATWRDRLISSTFVPERSTAILADGTLPRFGPKTCTEQTPAGTVAIEIRPRPGKGRPGEDHKMIGYRGDSGSWCMATGVGVITFEDGSRWLGQVSSAGDVGGVRNFLPRPDGLGEMIAQDGTRRPLKVTARPDILWGFDVRESLPPPPGAAPAILNAPAAVRTAVAAPAPPPQKVAAAAPVLKEAARPQPQSPAQAAGLTGSLVGGLIGAKSSQPAGSGARPGGFAALGLVSAMSAPAVTPPPVPKPAPVVGAKPTSATPRPAFDIIEGTSGLYMSPFTSDGVTSAWITKSMQVKAASQVGAMAGNYLGQKAMEQVPFVGGYLGKKAGQAMGRQVALSAIGGEEFLRSSTDLSFNTAESLVGWTLANHGSREDIGQIMQAVITIYPEVQVPYGLAAKPGKTGLMTPRPAFLQAPR